MVTPQTLLAIGIGLPLLMIAAYALWLGRRVARLEDRAPEPPEGGGGPERGDESPAGSDSGNF